MKMKKYLLLFGLAVFSNCFSSGVTVSNQAMTTLAGVASQVLGNNRNRQTGVDLEDSINKLAGLPTQFSEVKTHADSVARAFMLLKDNINSVMPGWLSTFVFCRAKASRAKKSIIFDLNSLQINLHFLCSGIIKMGEANEALNAANDLILDSNAALALELNEYSRVNRLNNTQKIAYFGVLILGLAAGSGLMGYKDTLLAWLRSKITQNIPTIVQSATT